MVIGALGTLLSVVGVFFVRTGEKATQKQLLGALGRGVNGAAVMIAVDFDSRHAMRMGLENMWGLWFALVAGLLTGIVIGQATEYFTSQGYAPTQAHRRRRRRPAPPPSSSPASARA